ncbi:MAG: glutamate 5-kinase [Gammaproteobacteria bacterium]|nr:glutamate 5-kinase [Gammaproteobacteria bacterium]
MDKRIVIKIGSQVLCDLEGALNRTVLSNLVEQIVDLHRAGWQVLLVSSGAVAAGSGLAGDQLRRISDPVARKQVLAATGQVRLMETYRELFQRRDMTIAQVLATKSDFQTRRHYLNMRGCIEALLSAGIVPVINENDVVAVTELMFTDNDELAGLLAGMVNAELLCLLSTVPGVYDGDPENAGTRCIERWDEDRYKVDDIVSRGASALGRGGMHNKLSVARKVARLGTEVVIADGTDPGVMAKILDNRATGTRFPVTGNTSPAKKWLASADGHATGAITVNEGAAEALLDRNRRASLLPVGIVAVDGYFDRGDVVRILDVQGNVLACGQAGYDHEEAARLIGQRGQRPLVHYDYLYLMD